MIWLWGLFSVCVLEAIVLRRLAREPFRRVLLRPVQREGWMRRPEPSPSAPGLEEALAWANETRASFPFHAYDPPGLDHPADFLAPARVRALVRGEEGTPGLTCATYVQLLSLRLRESGVPSRTVVGYRADGAYGHVMLEAAFPSEPGWVLIDVLYATAFQTRDGNWADTIDVQEWGGNGDACSINPGPAALADINSQPERLLDALRGGILERAVAFPVAPVERIAPKRIPHGICRARGGRPLLWRVHLLQFAALALLLLVPFLFLVARST